MIKMFLVFSFLLTACSHHIEQAQQVSNIQSADKNAKFMDPSCDPHEFNKVFEAHDRDIVVHKSQIMSHLRVKKGETIADVGAGTGEFERDLSHLVGPKGKVYAIDVAPNFIPYMKEKFKKETLKNVKVVQGKADETTLKEKSVSMVLVIDTYHHFDEPVKMLKDFTKILKKKGKLVVIDFERGPKAKPWINEHVQMTMDDYIKQISENGFRFLHEEPIPFSESFQLTFEKI